MPSVMRSPLPHDDNDTDAAAFSGEFAAWQQHKNATLFPHPHGELMVAPLNPNPTCHYQFIPNVPNPYVVPSSSEFTMDPCKDAASMCCLDTHGLHCHKDATSSVNVLLEKN